ncbi:MAG: 3-phosphoshikimate 1-carboxyvinyltransferase [Clostridiales bacterium]|nr:MAG: 3-phosphoshikimate 1-carboxyvinyltransferase [Clostridiales bacterium]
MRVSLNPGEFNGSLTVPPSKSMAHRLLIAASLANGESVIENIALSNDIKVTAEGLRILGADIYIKGNAAKINGIERFLPVNQPVNCGESGSTLRFFIPLFSLTDSRITFKGEGRLMQRPQNIYAQIFKKRRLMFEQKGDTLTISGPLTEGEYSIPGNVSSQFITGLLYALAFGDGESIIHITPPFESRSYVELTLEAQKLFGVDAYFYDDFTIRIKGNQKYIPCKCIVEGDYSQAAFWLVCGSICGNASVKGLLPNSKQGDRVILDILARCGANIEIHNEFINCSKASLKATQIDLSDCPDLGPILMVLALFCQGKTIISNAARLRMKESDRISSMQQEIAKMGGKILADENSVQIERCTLHKAENLSSHNDHRIAMSLAVAAVCAGVPVSISGAQAVNKSYPTFWEDLKSMGVKVDYYDE